MLDIGQVSLRGLRENAKLFDELIFDINSEYFEKKEIINQVSHSKNGNQNN